MLQDNAGTIKKLTQGLHDLKKDFDSGVSIQTAITSFQIQEDVGTICTCLFLYFNQLAEQATFQSGNRHYLNFSLLTWMHPSLKDVCHPLDKIF
jgi:hypothetical protein